MLLSSQRNDLEKGDVLELEFYDSQHQLSKQKVVIESRIGEGASCVSYLVRAYIDQENSRRMVLKEFYPDPYRTDLRIVRNPKDKSLSVFFQDNFRDYREYERKMQEFQEAFALQNQLSDSGSGEAMVKPYKLAKLGDSSYIVSDIFSGKVMYEYEMKNLEEKLTYMGRLAEAVELIHEQGYLCVDLHPGNILCIDTPKVVKLFDVDSLIRMDGTDLPESLKMTVPYGAPEIKRIKNRGITREWKRKYLNPGLDIYPLGVMLFEVLFGRLPGKEDFQSLQRNDRLVRELCRREKLEKDSLINRLRDILLQSMSENYYARFASAMEMYDEINLMLKEIGAQPFIPKKKMAEANYSYTSFHILERFPVFDYTRTEQGEKKLDISIVGSHGMRQHMLKTLLSCGQMLDSSLTIRIFAEDAKKFWEELTSEKNNPALAKAVTCHWEGGETKEVCDLSLVDKKLADIWLYSLSDISDTGHNSDSFEKEKLSEKIQKTGSRYVLLFGPEEENRSLAEEIAGQESGGDRRFIGYLTCQEASEEGNYAAKYGISETDCYGISMRRVTEEYNEEMFKSRIYRMGLQVHGYYYRGNVPGASWKEVEEDYRYSLYNMESSQRCALHGIYKMASIGIDWRSESAAEDFYRKVLSSREGQIKENFDNMAYLEHRSWTAFMLTHGHVQASMKEFRRYAYVGGNDWKDRRDKAHIKHPCLAAGRPGRGITDEVWEWADREKTDIEAWNGAVPYAGDKNSAEEALDALDQISLLVHMECCRIAEERKETIGLIFQSMEKTIDKQTYAEAEEALQWLKASAERCYSKEKNGEIIWRRALRDFKTICRKAGIYELMLKEDTRTLADMMQPALQVVSRHDFKKSDEDIVRALPALMEIGKTQGSEQEKRILIKPVSKHPCQNVFGSLLLEPQKLILVSEGKKTDIDFYQYFFQCRGLDKIFVSTRFSHFSGGKVYVDFTGVQPETVHRLMNNPDLKNAVGFTIENRKIKPFQDASLQMFQKEILLTVEEMLYLSNVADLSKKKKEPVTRIEWAQCKNLWFSCVENGFLMWKTLTEILSNVEKKKRWTVKLNEERTEEVYTYCTEHIPAVLLTISGLREVLMNCRKWSLITDLVVPKENQDIPVRFKTEYRELGRRLEEFAEAALEKPFEHHYVISECWEETLEFVDNTLYVEADVSERAFAYKGNIMDSIYFKGGNIVFQNLKIYPVKKGIHISFSYASEAVRAVLRKEKLILEVLVYQECLRNHVFDDIRMASEFQWKEDYVCNEMDIIGVKNSKIFFIYTAMTPLEVNRIEDLETMVQRVSEDGQGVLVCGEFIQDEDDKRRINEMKEECGRRNIFYIGIEEIMDKSGEEKQIILGEKMLQMINEMSADHYKE